MCSRLKKYTNMHCYLNMVQRKIQEHSCCSDVLQKCQKHSTRKRQLMHQQETWLEYGLKH